MLVWESLRWRRERQWLSNSKPQPRMTYLNAVSAVASKVFFRANGRHKMPMEAGNVPT